MRIEPSVGRVVWFWSSNVEKAKGLQPMAALVAHIMPPDGKKGLQRINVCFFDITGAPHAATSVCLVQEGEKEPDGEPFVTWMPYQQAVAKGELQPTKHVVAQPPGTQQVQPPPTTGRKPLP